jgi:hypothetical protein
MRHRLSSRTGLTLIEVVIGLLFLGLFQPLLITSISLAAKTDYQWTQRQNQIGVLQLRRKLAQGVGVLVSDREVSAIINDQRIRWVCEAGELVQNPGSMPYLINLSSCSWRKAGQYLMLSFSGGNTHQELIMGIIP